MLWYLEKVYLYTPHNYIRMRSYRKTETCADDAYFLKRLLTERLSAAMYTMQYVIPMKSIKITSVSDNFQAVTGCDVSKFRNYREFYEKIVTQSNEFFQFLKDSGDAEKICERKYTVHAESGGQNVLLDYTFSRKLSNELIEYTGIVTNITSAEIYKLAFRISEERLRVALAASGAGFFDWEIGSEEIFCDDITMQLLGMHGKRVSLTRCLRVIDRSQLRKHLSKIREIFQGTVHIFEEDVKICLPSERWVCISGKVIEHDPVDNKPRRIAGTVRDITTVKNILLERERLNEVLEKRVHERTERLESELATKVAAEKQLIKNLERERELNNTKSIFVNMVSHEFRTPLAIIQTAVEMMLKYFGKFGKEEVESSLSSIQHAVYRMTKTMDDVLVLGKVQTSQMKFNPSMTDVLFLCSNIVDELENSLSVHRIILETGENVPENLFVDGGLIRYILSNLLSNALKYSEDVVILRVDYRGTNLELYVEDHGIGIPKEDFESIFKLFCRGSNVSNQQGIGVGMFIVKYCVNLHHGEIFFHSTNGKGTRFRIVLPTEINPLDEKEIVDEASIG